MVDKTGTVVESAAVPIARLRTTVEGQVLVPGDPGYDRARAVYLGGMRQRPAVIVRAAGTADVTHVIGAARDCGAPLAIKSGGHSMFCLCDGGIVLDLSAMRELDIDPASRTAWAQTGLTAGEFTDAAAEHDLATGFGDTGSVGLGGIIVGGGIGYLVRKFGLTIDDLLAAEVVDADGELHRIDDQHEPELFWAVRGGGGNFGVVTRVRLRMHELRTVVGGMLVLPGTPDVIAGFVAAAREAPEELSTIANIMPSPPIPFVPERLHGTPIVIATVVYAGDGERAERAVAPLRALATPIADMVAPMPYTRVYPPEEDFHPVAATRNLFVDAVDTGAATTILEQLHVSTATMPAVQIRVLGGAMGRVSNDATAFAHRHRDIMVNIAAIYDDPQEVETHTGWVRRLGTLLQDGTSGAYVNFLAEDSKERIREAYPEPTWSRLRAVKKAYDPTNLFRVNNNIAPAGD